jgi:hypothetical protein
VAAAWWCCRLRRRLSPARRSTGRAWLAFICGYDMCIHCARPIHSFCESTPHCAFSFPFLSLALVCLRSLRAAIRCVSSAPLRPAHARSLSASSLASSSQIEAPLRETPPSETGVMLILLLLGSGTSSPTPPSKFEEVAEAA